MNLIGDNMSIKEMLVQAAETQADAIKDQMMNK